MATKLITCSSCTRSAKRHDADFGPNLCNYCYNLAGWYNSMQDGEAVADCRAGINSSFSKLKSVLKAKELPMPLDFIELHNWANGEEEAKITVTHDDDVPEVEGPKHTTGILVADVAKELDTNPKALRARLRKMGLNAPYNFTPELVESLKK